MGKVGTDHMELEKYVGKQWPQGWNVGEATRHVSYGRPKHLKNGVRTDKAWENGQNGWKRVNVTQEPW